MKKENEFAWIKEKPEFEGIYFGAFKDPTGQSDMIVYSEFICLADGKMLTKGYPINEFYAYLQYPEIELDEKRKI